MNDINLNGLLAQMRSLAALAAGQTPQPDKVARDFGTLLKQAVDQVNQVQQSAQEQAYAFEMEQKMADLPETMIALQKAQLAFQGLLQVRNRLIEAYKDIMSMPL